MMPHIDLGFMPERTKEIFEKLSTTKFIGDYTLVGGTALSIQIQHRQSEDLDFIFDGENIDSKSIKRNIAKIFPGYRIIKQDGNFQIDFIIDNIRLTFFSTGAILVPFSIKNYSFSYKNINIAETGIIASLKIAALAQRNTIRDYYDIYYIAKHIIPLGEIIAETKRLFPGLSPITYTETLTYTDDLPEENLANHLMPVENINKEDISAFLVEELRKTYLSS